jgi:hypothetical protein
MSKKLSPVEKEVAKLNREIGKSREKAFLLKRTIDRYTHQLNLVNAKGEALTERYVEGIKKLRAEKAMTIMAPNRPVMYGCQMTEQEVNTGKSVSYIQAIKDIRTRTNLGLKEAKELCDATIPREERKLANTTY